MSSGGEAHLPEISGRESFDVLVGKLSFYVVKAVEAPHSFEELRSARYGKSLQPLVQYLADEVEHRLTVAALLALKNHFTVEEFNDDRGIFATRALACELLAWRFVVQLSDRDAVDYLCAEVPPSSDNVPAHTADDGDDDSSTIANEETPFIADAEANIEGAPMAAADVNTDEHGDYFSATFQTLNALEIAAVTDSKKFLSQKAVQRIIDGIWKGDIVFWDSLNSDSKKQAKFYNPNHSDPFCRLRVPLYMKTFEVIFFAAFLSLYYSLQVTRPLYTVSAVEIALYIWITAFAYNELGEFWDAGLAFYAVDFWALWDLGIITNGFIFFVTRMVGLAWADRSLIDTAYDILSIEALFLVPRICSVLSLHPYFGTILPCLKEMTKDFIKFLGLVAILYIGFNTCFAFLARGTYSFREMSYILVKVFFGSSYLGFDVAEKISPILGPPLMIVFVCLTNILLITSLISLLSNTLSRMIQHSRDEYLFVYAVYVLEASTSNRLTYYLPPLNLVPLFLRPLRLVVTAESLRSSRIFLLKALHWPLVACIIGFEHGRQFVLDRRSAKSSFAATPTSGAYPPAILRRPLSSSKSANSRSASHHSRLGSQPRFAAHKIVPPGRASSSHSETIDTLELLARNLENQLDAVHMLLEREKAKESGGAAAAAAAASTTSSSR